MNTILRGGTIVRSTGPDTPYECIAQDVRIAEGKVAALMAPGTPVRDAVEVNVSGLWLVPGLTQTHTHLVQTLFRGLADDLALLDWLRERIWPLEAAHDHESVYWSARLGLSEMLLGGTTAILDMASVRHTDAIFKAAQESGIKAHIGKAMMDRPNEAGLSETTEESVKGSIALRDRWHGMGRLQYAFAPRFVPSCTETLLRLTVDAAREAGCLIHSHASENIDEVALVRQLTGMENIEYLDHVGMLGSDVVLAHCIHMTEHEIERLAESGTVVAHCPSSNFKLGSGIARVPELVDAGVRVTIGSDGAPCNNRMDVFAEMRLAALMQKPRLGPQSLPARRVLDFATINGSEVLGTGGGRIDEGCRADIVAINPNQAHSWGGGPPDGAIVYACTPKNVRHVWVDGDQLVRDGELVHWNWSETLESCKHALARVVNRAVL